MELLLEVTLNRILNKQKTYSEGPISLFSKSLNIRSLRPRKMSPVGETCQTKFTDILDLFAAQYTDFAILLLGLFVVWITL